MFCSVSTEKANYLVYSVITLSYVYVCEKVFPAPLGAFDMLCLLVALYSLARRIFAVQISRLLTEVK